MGRSSMQGTSWHYVNRWELKEKDEFAWETKEDGKKTIKRKQKNKNRKKEVNHVELSKMHTHIEKNNFHGNFILKFEGESEIHFIIGKNISKDAEMVKLVFKTSVGDYVQINGEKALVISKNMN